MPSLGPGEHDLAAGEDEQDNFGTLQLVDQARKQLWLVVAATELFVLFLEAFEFDAEPDVA